MAAQEGSTHSPNCTFFRTELTWVGHGLGFWLGFQQRFYGFVSNGLSRELEPNDGDTITGVLYNFALTLVYLPRICGPIVL